MTDHCTLWPEGTWAYCCAAHDLAYANPAVAKLAADLDMIHCVAAAAGWPMAILMGAGVITLGAPFWLRARLKSRSNRVGEDRNDGR